MGNQKTASIRLRFPGDLDYIPAVRKFVSETLQARDRDSRFAFRSEIVVDEICNNAVTFGCKSYDAEVELLVTMHGDRTEFVIRDPGGTKEDKNRLVTALEKPRNRAEKGDAEHRRLGIEIVRMLSEEIDIKIEEGNLTTVRVVRKRDAYEPAVETPCEPIQ